MKSTIDKTPDGTIELKLTIPWSEVKKEWGIVVSDLASNTTLPGFRKGKAPKKLIEEKLEKAKIRDEIIKKLLPQAYSKAIREYKITPITDPQIHIEGELADGKDWQFHALTCERPIVDLNGYKNAVKKVTAKSKIIVPGKEKEEPKTDEILKALTDSSKTTIPNILVRREVDRLLSQALDEIKRLGMTLDQYLSSTRKTAEDLRREYEQKAESDLKLELVLQKVAETEKIVVEESEIQRTIDDAKTEEKQSLESNRYVLASIIRQRKTLDFLKSLLLI